MRNSNVCILLLKQDNQYTRISVSLFDRLLSGSMNSAEFANAEIRYLIFVFPKDAAGLGSDYHVQSSYGVLRFHKDGFIDQEFLKLSRQIESVSVGDRRQAINGNVIDASVLFDEKRQRNKYRWNPSVETQAALLRVANAYCNNSAKEQRGTVCKT
jgi:hypothetical protein